MIEKGIILAGGSGTRLYPLTQVISKQLMPIYDKPMIYYPLSTLLLANIRNIFVITTPQDQPLFKELLKDGRQWGVNISYGIQPSPDGLAQSFIIGKDFIGNDGCSLILGDNIFYGHELPALMEEAQKRKSGATIFSYWVKDPQKYGVAEFGPNNKVISIKEKPQNPKSNFAITGLYFYDNQVVDIASSIKPSARGELEITDVNRVYLEQSQLSVKKMSRGFAWLDTGSHESLLDASNFIETIQRRQGLMVCCPEEIAYSKGWITAEDMEKLALSLNKNEYGQYLLRLIQQS
ncbi:MAG: glucose-1-phosphate thymidylyltransferase RfbA [Nitrospinaceae bacterium]